MGEGKFSQNESLKSIKYLIIIKNKKEAKLKKVPFTFLKLILLSIIITSSFNLSAIKNVGSLNLNLEKVTHEGDLIIQSDEEYLIEGKEFTQIGSIIVRENGRLILKNSTLIIDQEYQIQYNILIRENGYFEALDSEIDSEFTFVIQFGYSGLLGEFPPTEPETPKGFFRNVTIEVYAAIRVQDGGELEVYDSIISHIRGGYVGSNVTVDNSTIGDFRFFEESKVEISNSTLLSLWPYLRWDIIATLYDLKSGFYSYWHLGAVQNAMYDFTMTNTTIEMWIPYVSDSAEITFVESEISMLALYFFSGSPIITNLDNDKYYEYWSLKDLPGVQCDHNIILKQTSVIQWGVSARYETEITLDQCSITSLAMLNSSTAHILNSKIDGVSFNDFSSGEIKNSQFYRLLFRGGYSPGTISNMVFNFDNTIVKGDISIEVAILTLTGDISFDNAKVDRWYESNVNREYNVIIKDNYGPLSNIGLELYSPENNLIWVGETDSNGEAKYEISFNDSNYQEDWKLKVKECNFETNISFLTSTPLIIFPQYSLILTSGTGGTTDPAPDTYTYDEGTEVSITATAESGYRFSGWTGDVPSGHENDNPITITMDSDKSVTANFIRQYTLTITAGTGGTTDPAPGSHKYDSGAEVTITATPENGYRFSGWSDDASGITNPITITMDSDKSITANFIQQYTLTIAASAGGTTYPAPGNYTYDVGTEVSITATPESEYRFTGWTGDVPSGHESNNPLTITIDSDKSITANFIQQHTLTIAASAGGTTTPSPGDYAHDSGTQVSITAIPNSGYSFDGWSGDVPEGQQRDNPLTVMMNSNITLTANFTLNTYILTAQVDPSGGGSVTVNPDRNEYSHGESVELTANASEGYAFSTWTGDVPSGHENDNPIVITMHSDKSITANFNALPYDETGNGEEARKMFGCFIATAAYGSPLHPSVEILRNFRDKYLMPSKLGSKLVNLYYKYSPSVADLIAKYKVLRVVVRMNLLPMIAFSYSMLHFGPAITAFFLGFIFVLPYFFVCFYKKRTK